MKKTKWLSVVLAIVLVFSLCSSAFAVEFQPADSEQPLLSSLPNQRELTLSRQSVPFQAGDQVRVVVLTESQPLAENHTLIEKLTNTEGKLLREHNAVKAKMEKQSIAFQVNFEYTNVLNGMSVTMDYADLETVAALPGVKEAFVAKVYRQPELQPQADSASEMIGAAMLNATVGANGSGKVIAVLDTGITADHEAFGVYDGMLQTPAYTEGQMRSKIVALGHGDYFSQKVPFMYDYADGDNDAIDDGSSHGSHVSGIAAGYAATDEGEVTFYGSAPDAQIVAMKIFSSTEKTTSSDIYFAALEDAYKLDVDVINMSIGAPNGFTWDSELETEEFGNIYQNLEDAGIICCISAGNENTMGEYSQNWTGGGYVKADYPDFGVLGSPASYDGNVAVAAVENAIYPAYLISVGEEGYPYRDSNGTALLDAFGGQDLEYVMVPDLGVAEAFEGLDVAGKVAVISRGEITFAEKVANAANAGAIAAVIYDNVEGALVSMAIDNHVIPSVFVEKAAGAVLANAETKTLHVNDEPTVMENPDAWSVAAFSSWGPTNDLQIKPTISGIGGNVNSALAGTKDGYEVASGTSMSAPNVSGGYAALLEAICNEDPSLSKAEAADLARNRTLSHAYVLPSAVEELEDGSYLVTPYSPRQQGAGLMEVVPAFNADVDIADPLCELGDDPDRTGVFTVTSELTNNYDEELTFTVEADVLMDDYAAVNAGSKDEPYYIFYNALVPYLLDESYYSLDAPESITLQPGETKTVTVTISLTEDAKDEFDYVYPNGNFIDGYVYFISGVEDVHSTFLGFYGDWTEAPIIEQHDWRELMNVEVLYPDDYPNPIDYVDWDIDTTPSVAYLVDDNISPVLYAGDSPLTILEPGEYSDARIAVSNDPSSAYFTKLIVVPTTIRNARHIIMIVSDAETGDIYAVDDMPYCPKTIFDPDEGAFSSYAWFMFDGTDSYSSGEAIPLPDDTKVNIELYANLPYGEDELGAMTPEEIVADGSQYLAYSVPCVVDSTGPDLEITAYDEETGELTITASDNQYLAGVYLTDAEGHQYALDEEGHPYAYIHSEHEEDEETPVFMEETFADAEPGEEHEVTFNISELYSFCICAMDYATNEVYGYFYFDHEHEMTEVEAVEPTCVEDGFAAHYVCDLCGFSFADEAGEVQITHENEKDYVLPALGHDLQKVEAVEPTCTEDGNVEYWQCSRCGECYVAGDGMEEIEPADVIVPAAGHKLTAVEEVPASCETEGAKAHFQCECCGKLFSDAEGTTEIEAPEVIHALGHAWDEGVVTKEPTLVSEGEKLFTCQNDPSHTRTEVIDKLYDCDGGDNCPSKDFTDVDRSAKSWSHAAIDWAVLEEITNGTSKTTFSPDKTCTRAEAVTFLWRAAGCPEPKDVENPFTDVTLDTWYAKAVLWAVEEGITKGTSETTFSPDETCIRGQIVTFLWRMQDEPEAKEASSFSDVDASAYYAQAIDWAVEEGITNGVSATKFAPKSDCTRAHIVTFLFRCLGE